MARWLEHSVTVKVDAPLEKVWAVWSNLAAMPRWMRWIESVRELEDPNLTEWTLVAQGFRFTWKARITRKVERQQLHWESVAGLPTRGAARFYEEDDGASVKLGIAYALPVVLAPLMDARLLGGLVEKELQVNLEHFKALVEADPADGSTFSSSHR